MGGLDLSALFLFELMPERSLPVMCAQSCGQPEHVRFDKVISECLRSGLSAVYEENEPAPHVAWKTPPVRSGTNVRPAMCIPEIETDTASAQLDTTVWAGIIGAPATEVSDAGLIQPSTTGVVPALSIEPLPSASRDLSAQARVVQLPEDPGQVRGSARMVPVAFIARLTPTESPRISEPALSVTELRNASAGGAELDFGVQPARDSCLNALEYRTEGTHLESRLGDTGLREPRSAEPLSEDGMRSASGPVKRQPNERKLLPLRPDIPEWMDSTETTVEYREPVQAETKQLAPDKSDAAQYGVKHVETTGIPRKAVDMRSNRRPIVAPQVSELGPRPDTRTNVSVAGDSREHSFKLDRAERPEERPQTAGAPVVIANIRQEKLSIVSRDFRVMETAPIDPAVESPRPVTREITLRIESRDREQQVDVVLVERAGNVHVTVRSGNRELTESLRSELADLAHALDRSGYRTETWTPAETFPGENLDDRQRAPAQEPDKDERQRRASRYPDWLKVLEERLHKEER